MSWRVSDGRIRTSAPITPIRRLYGVSAPLCVINTVVTRGRMELHSRGGGGASPQGPIPPKNKNPIKKNPGGRNRLGRGPKFPHSETRSSCVLKLGLRRRPGVNRRVCGCWTRGAGASVWKYVRVKMRFFFGFFSFFVVFLLCFVVTGNPAMQHRGKWSFCWATF